MRTWMMIAAALSLMACDSPETTRTRGGGPGADLGNRGEVIKLHGGAEPFYKTPKLLEFRDKRRDGSKQNQQAAGR